MHASSELTVPSDAAQARAALAVLAAPPLIRGEEASSYDALLGRVSGTVRPADVFEEIWVRDIVDLVWEVVRLRRQKAGLMTYCARDGLADILIRLRAEPGLALGWALHERKAVAQVDRVLAAAGLGIDAVMGQTLRLRIGEIERIDRMTALAEARRNAALHEIERHRANFAALLRRAAQEAEKIEDAEFAEVAPQQTGQTPPGCLA